MQKIKQIAAMLLLTAGLAGGGDVASANTPPAAAPHEPRVALVIGNANYSEANKLLNPANDATLISDTLKTLGFDVILVTDAAQKPMQRAIVDFGDRLAKAGPDAVGLFYYAGHGLQLDGENYLIPIDADISREVDVELDGVSADLVLKQMAYAESRVNIVILDACRNNPLARDYRSVAASQGFAEIRTKPKGTFISYSTAPGEVAVDGNDGHSPFAEALAKAMHEPGLDLPEVFQHVREQVLAATGDRQTPWDSSSLVKSFYFVPPADKTDNLVAATTPAAPAPVQTAEVTRQHALEPVLAPIDVAEAPTASPSVTTAQPVVQVASAESDSGFVTMTRSLFAKPGSRLRAAPRADAAIVAKLPANAEIRAVARSQDGTWWEVTTKQGETAYVHADAVSDFRAAKVRQPKPATQAIAMQQPVYPANQSTTGIGVVDRALNWLSTASKNSGPTPNIVRATK